MTHRFTRLLLSIILCTSGLGCAHVDAVPDIPAGKKVKSLAGEGSEFFYRRDVHSSQSDMADSLSIRLISKIATIGGRADLLAFMGDEGQTSIWDMTENGDLWRYSDEPIAPDPSDPMRSSGTWVCYPTSDTGRFSAITVDTTINVNGSYLRTRVRYDLESLGMDSIYIDDKGWAVHKIHYRRAYDRWLNGSPRGDGSFASGVRSYITDLGILAEQHDSVTTPGYDYELSFKLCKTDIK
jgi:hypothetical protein